MDESAPSKMTPDPADSEGAVKAILHHWQAAVPQDRMAHLVKDAWRGLTRAFSIRLSEHAVLFGHWIYLRILWERDGLTQSELSHQAGLMLPTTFAALKTMERLGYIQRKRDPANRRSVQVFLTEQGHGLRALLVPLAEEVNAIALDGVPEKDVATTRRTLLAMIEHLAQDELNLLKAKRRLPSTRELANVNESSSAALPSGTRRRGKSKPPKSAPRPKR